MLSILRFEPQNPYSGRTDSPKLSLEAYPSARDHTHIPHKQISKHAWSLKGMSDRLAGSRVVRNFWSLLF